MNGLFIPQSRQVLNRNLSPNQAALQLIPSAGMLRLRGMKQETHAPQDNVQRVADLVCFHTNERWLFDLRVDGVVVDPNSV